MPPKITSGTITIRTQVRRKPDAAEFFELVVLPLWQRFLAEKHSLDLCCAVTVMLDQMVDWIAVERGDTPKKTRDRLAEKAPEIATLNLVARALKHRELDRGDSKGLRDIFCEGMPSDKEGVPTLPPVFWPDAIPGKHPPGPRVGTGVNSEELLRTCINAVTEELG